MAKKSVEGQMDLFELFGSVEELEENVKGVPELPEDTELNIAGTEPEAESDVKTTKRSSDEVVMQKTFLSSTTKQTAVIAYLNYNKVYQKIWEGEPIIYQFEQSKDAVDYYVSQMAQFSEDKQIEVLKEQEALKEATVIPWVKE